MAIVREGDVHEAATGREFRKKFMAISKWSHCCLVCSISLLSNSKAQMQFGFEYFRVE